MIVVINAAAAKIGGAVTYLLSVLPSMASHLREAGCTTVILATPEVSAKLSQHLEGAQVRIISSWWMTLPALLRVVFEQLWLPFQLRRLKAHVLLGVSDTLPLLSGTPGVVLCRNALIYAEPKETARLRLMGYLSRFTLKRAALVIFVSKTMADAVLGTRPLAKHTVIHHGPGLAIPEMPPRQLQSPVRLLAMSSLYAHKRVEIAIEATAILRDFGFNVSLTVVGAPIDTEYVAKLRQLTNRLHVTENIRFAGEADSSTVVSLYRLSSVLLVTSRSESFCHPILEAFRARTAVVVPTDLPIAREIAGPFALHCEPTGMSFARAVEKLLVENGLYHQLQRGGYERSREFDWSYTGAATARCLIDVMRAN